MAESRQCVNITLLDDIIAELNETFLVELLAVSGPVTVGATSSASVTILDDDGTFQVFSVCIMCYWPLFANYENLGYSGILYSTLNAISC